jgi:arginine exporter protein ArgO
VITSFVAGAVAGYGIAIPVGAISVLIIETGIRRGFAAAAVAGTGAASADGIFAAVAAVGGLALAGLIAPFEVPLKVASVVVLLAIAGRTVRTALAERSALRGAAGMTDDGPGDGHDPGREASLRRTYVTFLGLTLLNPMTIVYFAALVLGLPAIGDAVGERVAFVAGAFLASASWQWLVAGVAALLHRRLPRAFRSIVGLTGALVVVGFAVGIALSI